MEQGRERVEAEVCVPCRGRGRGEAGWPGMVSEGGPWEDPRSALGQQRSMRH